MQCVLDHIVLNVQDVTDMIEFYTTVLELPTERWEAFRAGKVPFPSLRLNADTIIDLFPRDLWQTSATPAADAAPNLNHFCLVLEPTAWRRLGDRLEAHHVTVETGPVPRWGAHGTGTSIYFRDPEGNLIEARYYEIAATDQPCLLGS